MKIDHQNKHQHNMFKNQLAPHFGGNGIRSGKSSKRVSVIKFYPYREHIYEDLESLGCMLYPKGNAYSGGNYDSYDCCFNGAWYRVCIPQEGIGKNELYAQNLISNGRTHFDSVEQFLDTILPSIKSKPRSDYLVSLIYHVKNGEPFHIFDLSVRERNYIDTAFDEVLCMIHSLLQGHSIIVPVKTNEPGFDYIQIKHDIKQWVSVKQSGTSGNLHLSFIHNVTDGFNPEDPIERILYAIATKEKTTCSQYKGELLEAMAKVCPKVNDLKNIVGSFFEEDLLEFMDTHSFLEYITELRKISKYGIPKFKNGIFPQWGESYSVIHFAALTLMREFSKMFFSDIMHQKVLQLKDKFFYKRCSHRSNTLVFDIEPIESHRQWHLHYWGNAKNAWNNFPGVAPL